MLSALDDPQKLQAAVLYLIALILSICVHEFGHAWVADRLGDPLPRSQGRVTLNPLAHIDLLGTIVFPLIIFFTGANIIGWGKPVQWTAHPRYITRRVSMRTAHVLVSIAGPAMNVLFALLFSIVFIILVKAGQIRMAPLAAYITAMNIGLALFNLIPIPPLDGRSLLFWFLPPSNPVRQALERYGSFLFLLFVLSGLMRVALAPIQWVGDQWIGLLIRLVS